MCVFRCIMVLAFSCEQGAVGTNGDATNVAAQRSQDSTPRDRLYWSLLLDDLDLFRADGSLIWYGLAHVAGSRIVCMI